MQNDYSRHPYDKAKRIGQYNKNINDYKEQIKVLEIQKIDGSTKMIHGHDTVNIITEKISLYKQKIAMQQQRELPSPFEHISNRLLINKPSSSKAEILLSYMEEVKKDLQKHFQMEKGDSTKTMSMSSNDQDDNQFSCLAGEAQPIDE
ncbi:hypothetical protein L1987_02040 [Smallanthus sonchifolius]|uniref:Uncharacterized protein n=1 Tax=Smallanthus sonchifolius TaxID=185202 RepID=A0ACB9K6W5_9ASTR|nr:hypothetical protein L1987_02040 [Smallanthus sonchifolius]